MQQKIQLQINEPCHEDWDKMTVHQQSRFCNACQKMVVDFTTMSDEKLLAYFKNYDGNTCGRFDDGQLNRTLLANIYPKNSSHKWTFAILFASFLLFNKAKAQGKIVLKERMLEKKLAKTGQFKKAQEIIGKVVDENGNGIPYASVLVKNESWGTSTDSLGHFKLTINTCASTVELQISSVGYISNQLKVDFADAIANRQIAVLTAQNIGDEVVIIGYGATRCRSLSGAVSVFQEKSISTKAKKVQDDVVQEETTTNRSFKCYPNPAKAGSSVTLQFNEPNNYLVKLINMNGQVLSTQNIPIHEKMEISNFVIPASLSAGQYYLDAVVVNSTMQITNKLIVVR